MDRKMNQKSQENDPGKRAFLQIPLLQIRENAKQINGVPDFHGEPVSLTMPDRAL
jgi:hypothetical protein